MDEQTQTPQTPDAPQGEGYDPSGQPRDDLIENLVLSAGGGPGVEGAGIDADPYGHAATFISVGVDAGLKRGDAMSDEEHQILVDVGRALKRDPRVQFQAPDLQ